MMIAPARARTIQARKLRAERILDSAAELLCRWGYNRVTIEDVAAHAQVGKGTIYLHWKTREELFYSVIMREYTDMIDEYITAVRDDPQQALLHRMVRLKYLAAMRRPILRALYSADPEVLGRLASEKYADLARLFDVVSTDYHQILVANNLVRQGLSATDLIFGVGAISNGFIMADAFLASLGLDLDLERKADILEAAIERTFEVTPSPEVLHALVPRVTEMLGRIREISQASVHRAYKPRLPGTGETQ